MVFPEFCNISNSKKGGLGIVKAEALKWVWNSMRGLTAGITTATKMHLTRVGGAIAKTAYTMHDDDARSVW